ncbi:MAG: hypothetical protein U5K75_05470 [Ahrensia sp.]|nr:hypothetical protein [Ahrensia sp.]
MRNLQNLEKRLVALETESWTKTERDTLEVVIKVVKGIESTLWLGKFLGGIIMKLAPLIATIWFFGEQAWQWLLSWRY